MLTASGIVFLDFVPQVFGSSTRQSFYFPTFDIISHYPTYFGWPGIAYCNYPETYLGMKSDWSIAAVAFDASCAALIFTAVAVVAEWRARAIRSYKLHGTTLVVLIVVALPFLWLNTRMISNLDWIEYHEFRQRPYDGKKLGALEYEWYGWPEPCVNFNGFNTINVLTDALIVVFTLSTCASISEYLLRRRERVTKSGDGKRV